MSANLRKSTNLKDETQTAISDPASTCDAPEAAVLNGDYSSRSALRQDSNSKIISKKVKIVDPKTANELESDEDDSLSQPVTVDKASSAATPSTSGQPTDPQATATAVTDRKKTREERKKEREKKKEEEMLKKYQAEQEAKQKTSAKSKCGRWIKHNLKIGEGGYKFVYRGYDTVEAKNVAWCEFKREHVDTKEKRQAMFKETEIMLKMNHPHIVRCFDVFREWIDMEDPNNQIEEKGVVIIQELMGEGTLKSVIRKNFLEGQCILKFPLLTRWWHQILDALRYMHHKIQPPILHRDLKADNCFLYGASDEEYLNVKVGDFGLATHVNNSGRKTMLGTLGFMAPEIFDEKYDEKVDIYAFGMLMLEVMTNRTPYDECETVLQVAAKTMSGQGPDIMEKISNPSLREVISACIQPLTCFRPTAEELYFHPLFQRYQEVDDSWPKTLPVEVEPNYDNATDRVEVLDRFVRSLENTEALNPNFNLRLRFRDKKMLQELGLDDGESLEFDLDIYKAEDQDIPDLIHNLRLGYEDKLWRVFENPKQPDKKIVSNHLDKLFNSIRLQMQFLVKVLLGKRWKAILDSLVSEPRARRRQEPTSKTDEDEESDADARDASSFAIIGNYKSKWSRAKKLLEKEIQAYRNATAITPTSATTSGTNVTTTTTTVACENTVGASTTSILPAVSSANTGLSTCTITPATALGHPTHPLISNVDTLDLTVTTSGTTTSGAVTTVGKFSITTPTSAAVAPALVNNGSTPVPTPLPTPVPSDTIHNTQQRSVAQHVNLQSQPGPISDTAQHTQVDADGSVTRTPSDSTGCQVEPSASAHILSQASTYPTPYASNPPPSVPGAFKSGPDGSLEVESSARANILLQQVLQRISNGSLKGVGRILADLGLFQSMVQQNPSSSGTQSLLAQHLTPQQQQQLLIAAAAALATEQAVGHNQPGVIPITSSVLEPGLPQDSVLPSHLLNAVVQSDITPAPQSFPPGPPPIGIHPSVPATGLNQTLTGSSSKVHAAPMTDHQASITGNLTTQSGSVATGAQATDSEGLGTIDPVLLNRLVESLVGLTVSASGSGSLPAIPPGNGYMLGLVQQAAQPTPLAVTQPVLHHGNSSSIPQSTNVMQQQQILIQSAAGLSPKQGDRRVKKKSKSKPRYILRVTKLERDTDSNEPGAIRPTFYLEMPDLNNPNCELWKLSFRCNLSDTLEDIKLFQSSGYTPANEEIERAAKEAVVYLLESLRMDVNSIKLNQDYVFYPRSSAQFGSISLQSNMDTGIPTAVPTFSVPGSVGIGALLTARSSQSSFNLPSMVPYGNLATNQGMGPIGSIRSVPGVIPVSGSSAFSDGNATVTSLEEVPPIDRIGQVVPPMQIDDQNAIRVTSSAVNVVDGPPGAMDTVRDDEDEFSETSRPLSPIESVAQAPPPHSLHQFFVGGMEVDPASRSTFGSLQTPYLSASSCGITRSTSEGVHGTSAENTDPSLFRRPIVPFSLTNVGELVSLAMKQTDPSNSAGSGVQCGLEEVPPLAPGICATDSSTQGYLPSSDTVAHPDFVAYDSTIGARLDHPTHPPHDINSGVVSQLSHVSSVSQGRVCPSQPYCTSTPDSDSMINLTCTIPASLEALLRDVTCRLCNAPTRPYILLPSMENSALDGSTQVSSMRVLEVPSGHIFLGIPELKSPNQPGGSYSLTTFRAPTEPTFVVLNGLSSDGRVAGPHVYRTPSDCAVILSPNGVVHRLDKTALVVPVPPSDVPRTATPPLSPGLDTNISHTFPNGPVHVRVLPIQTNIDTLSFDGVLNLLLALRSTSQSTLPHRSNTTSPTIDSQQPIHPMMPVSVDNQTLPSGTSRRSSALPGLHGVNSTHSLHGLPAAQLLQPQPHTVTGFNQLQPHPSGVAHRSGIPFQPPQVAPVYPDAYYPSPQVPGAHTPFQLQPQVSASTDLSGSHIGSTFFAHVHSLPHDGVSNVQAGAYNAYNPMHAQSTPPSSVQLQPQSSQHSFLKPGVSGAPPLTQNISANLQQAFLQQFLQRPDQPNPHFSPAGPPQTSTDPLLATGQSVQQIIQILAALNVTAPDQILAVLNQLRATWHPVVSYPVPTSTSATALVSGGASTTGSTAQSRQGSPPLPASVKQSSVGAALMANIPQTVLAGTIGPSAPSNSNPSNINSLPALLGRLFASNLAKFDWSGTTTGDPVGASTTQPVQTAATNPRSSLPSSSQPLPTGNGLLMGHDSTSLGHTNAVGTACVVTNSLPQQTSQVSQQAGLHQKRGSQPSEAYTFGVPPGTINQSASHPVLPELANMLRAMQKYPEAGISKEISQLPVEIQNLLLGVLQQHQRQSLQQSHTLSNLQSGWVGSTPVPSCTVITQPVPSVWPKQSTSGPRIPPSVVPGSVVPPPAITAVDAMSPQLAVTKEPAKPGPFESTISQANLIPTGDPTYRPPPSIHPTTVANKFTVVPVSSENEEPASPLQLGATAGASGQWTQGSASAARRTTHPSGPPAPPVTPNSQLSSESECVGSVIPSINSDVEGSMIAPSAGNITVTGSPVISVSLAAVTSAAAMSSQPKLVPSKFKVEPVTIVSSASPNAGSVIGPAGSKRNPRMTPSVVGSALPVPATTVVHTSSNATSNVQGN